MIDQHSKEAYHAIKPDKSLKFKVLEVEPKQSTISFSMKLVPVCMLLLCCIPLLNNTSTAPELTQVVSSNNDVRTIDNSIETTFTIESSKAVQIEVSDGIITNDDGNEIKNVQDNQVITWTIEDDTETLFYLYLHYNEEVDKYLLKQNSNLEWIIERGKE